MARAGGFAQGPAISGRVCRAADDAQGHQQPHDPQHRLTARLVLAQYLPEKRPQRNCWRKNRAFGLTEINSRLGEDLVNLRSRQQFSQGQSFNWHRVARRTIGLAAARKKGK